MRRRFGVEAFADGRAGRQRKRRVPLETLEEGSRLEREACGDNSRQHVLGGVTRKHGLRLGDTMLRNVRQEADRVDKATGHGRSRR